jgi:hypothetical protein
MGLCERRRKTPFAGDTDTLERAVANKVAQKRGR